MIIRLSGNYEGADWERAGSLINTVHGTAPAGVSWSSCYCLSVGVWPWINLRWPGCKVSKWSMDPNWFLHSAILWHSLSLSWLYVDTVRLWIPTMPLFMHFIPEGMSCYLQVDFNHTFTCNLVCKRKTDGALCSQAPSYTVDSSTMDRAMSCSSHSVWSGCSFCLHFGLIWST